MKCKIHKCDLDWQECNDCNEEGFCYHDCGEDTCVCLNPEDNVVCDTCDGEAGWYVCNLCLNKAIAKKRGEK